MPAKFEAPNVNELMHQIIGAASSTRFWDGLPENYPYGAGTFLDGDAAQLAKDAIAGYQQLLGPTAQEDFSTPTYWNGEPVSAVRGTAIVADTKQFPQYWARTEGLIGSVIPVVCVTVSDSMGAHSEFLDNRDGNGWHKVTVGRGSWRLAHADVVIMPGSFVMDDPRYLKHDEPVFDSSVEDAEEETMRKVHDALGELGLTERQVNDAVNAMQNKGILFRERL